MFKNTYGFTIVELLIVIVVIAVLAAVSIVGYNGVSQRATEAAIASKESQAKIKLEAYKVDSGGTYPADQTTFDSLIGQKIGDELYTAYMSTSPYTSYTLSTAGGGGMPVALQPPSDCPSGFIGVPGNSTLGTEGFCVMKYEAKNGGSNTPVSVATGGPWTSISQTTAIANSQNACDGCHLITEAEWMTIAADVLSVPSNWSGGSVGSGYIYNGHTSEPPASGLAASSDDSDGNYGLSVGSTPAHNNRRTLTLTTGEVIWDLAGNAWEWTSGTIEGGKPGGSGGYAYYDYVNVTNWGDLPVVSRPLTIGAGGWGASQGIGQMYTSGTDTSLRAFLRSGGRKNGAQTGVLTLVLSYAPSATDSHIGFRVTR